MKLRILPLLVCATGIAFGQASTESSDLNAKPPENLKPQTGEPPMLGIHWSRDFAPGVRANEEAHSLILFERAFGCRSDLDSCVES